MNKLGHDYVHSSLHGRSKVQSQERQHKKGARLLLVHTAVFEYAPFQLKELLDGPGLSDTGEDIDDEMDDEIDSEIVDEDEQSPYEAADRLEYNVPSPVSAEPLLNMSPAVSLNSVYPLMVFPYPGNIMKCIFNVPDWLYVVRKKEARKFVKMLRLFITAIAGWLEQEKQSFLREPLPEHFVEGETRSTDGCIVQQKGFLERINDFGSFSKQERLKEDQFSRLLDKIWLFGEKWSFPLSAIFRKPYNDAFKQAWVVEVCAAVYSKADDYWLAGLHEKDGFRQDELDRMKQNLRELNPEELLYTLKDTLKTKQSVEELYRMIMERK